MHARCDELLGDARYASCIGAIATDSMIVNRLAIATESRCDRSTASLRLGMATVAIGLAKVCKGLRIGRSMVVESHVSALPNAASPTVGCSGEKGRKCRLERGLGGD